LSYTYKVSLKNKPCENVVIAVASASDAIATVDTGASLTFTPTAWSGDAAHAETGA
jgi:hypothetical protein